MLNMKDPTPREKENLQLNDQAFNVIYEAVDPKDFESIKDLEMAHQVWKRLEDAYECTSVVKEAKLYIVKYMYVKFKMLEDKSVPEMFYRLIVIVNELRNLGHEVDDLDFTRRFLRSLPLRFDTLVNIIVMEHPHVEVRYGHGGDRGHGGGRGSS